MCHFDGQGRPKQDASLLELSFIFLMQRFPVKFMCIVCFGTILPERAGAEKSNKGKRYEAIVKVITNL